MDSQFILEHRVMAQTFGQIPIQFDHMHVADLRGNRLGQCSKAWAYLDQDLSFLRMDRGDDGIDHIVIM